MEYIKIHNEEAAQGKHTFTLGVNKYADLTHAEWQQKFNARKSVDKPYHMDKPTEGRADSVDWRDEVSSPKILFLYAEYQLIETKYSETRF